MIFHGNKLVTALPRFLCFSDLSDYDVKWESAIKIIIYKKRKNNAQDRHNDRVFSKAASFAVSIENMNKTKQTSYI